LYFRPIRFRRLGRVLCDSWFGSTGIPACALLLPPKHAVKCADILHALVATVGAIPTVGLPAFFSLGQTGIESVCFLERDKQMTGGLYNRAPLQDFFLPKPLPRN
jgi:hypothetical protein